MKTAREQLHLAGRPGNPMGFQTPLTNRDAHGPNHLAADGARLAQHLVAQRGFVLPLGVTLSVPPWLSFAESVFRLATGDGVTRWEQV